MRDCVGKIVSFQHCTPNSVASKLFMICAFLNRSKSVASTLDTLFGGGVEDFPLCSTTFFCYCLRLRSQTWQAHKRHHCEIVSNCQIKNEFHPFCCSPRHLELQSTSQSDQNRKRWKMSNYYRIMSSSMIISAIENTYTNTRWHYVGAIIKTRGLNT